jgi:hypothetical protein
VKRLLLFLEGQGPGQWAVITNELREIFEVPEFRFKYAEYAEGIKSFLSGIEREGLVQLKIGDRRLYDAAFGDLNNVYCDLEKHDIQAKITKEGLEYITRLNRSDTPMFYLGQNAQFIYQSPDARIRTRTSITHQTPTDRKESLADKLTRFAKTITAAKAMVIAILSFLTSLGIFFGLWKSNNLPTLTFSQMKATHNSQKLEPDSPDLMWPSNLRYIDLDTVTGLSSSDLIVISWVKGHLEDSAVAQRLYVDLKNAGYKPQLIRELASIDNLKFKGYQFVMDLQLLHDYSRRIQVIINPDFNFFKE